MRKWPGDGGGEGNTMCLRIQANEWQDWKWARPVSETSACPESWLLPGAPDHFTGWSRGSSPWLCAPNVKEEADVKSLCLTTEVIFIALLFSIWAPCLQSTTSESSGGHLKEENGTMNHGGRELMRESGAKLGSYWGFRKDPRLLCLCFHHWNSLKE